MALRAAHIALAASNISRGIYSVLAGMTDSVGDVRDGIKNLGCEWILSTVFPMSFLILCKSQ